ncbi:pyridoxamine 5'-phosphate oxidase family protein [Thalassotalea atypica]|uniref:pyridoxamine 5'-phosphate oxidase family protein n=1 Tax=Thalassotalea atypica TaxID=2054316 RepID=UPI0025722A85|nr:pyridoxamine 5'-phosphate oxidase family protein [Thalassotalea atypica]
MAHQYAQVAFTETVRKIQTELGSRSGYAGMDVGEDYNHLMSEAEAEFISQRDSFYMASVSETEWPYVQHRGGPKGFLKIIDAQTLGFADYSGNRQYVSTGNFRKNDRVSLILMDYANKRRLKVLGHVTQVDEQDWDTLALLEDDHYRARVERGFIIKIVAFDWNCPQHITPRYSEEEIIKLIDPLQSKVKTLEAKLSQSKALQQSSNNELGDGPLSLTISGIRQLTSDVRAYELRAVNGGDLPKVAAGAHLQVPVATANGEIIWRHYSISTNPARTDCYEIAVKNESQGHGGSKAIHLQYQVGHTLHCQLPDNYFSIDEEHKHTVLIAAGIGITPIKAMALELLAQQSSFELHYAGRELTQMAYADRLTRQLGDKLHLYPANQEERISLIGLLQTLEQHSHVYFCGPQTMLIELKKLAAELNIAPTRIHYEQFSAPLNSEAQPVQLTLAKSGIDISISADESLLEGVLNAGVEVPFSCQTGECKSCVVSTNSAVEIDHQDNCLTVQERESGKLCLCVSRPKSDVFVIDL